MRRAWRLCRAPFQPLDGEGARLYGGRWNEAGVPVVYAASSLALAALEYLVHVDPEDAPEDLVALALDVPDDAPTAHVAVADLPTGWEAEVDSPSCRAVGGAWLREGAALALHVPSALVPEEANVLLNPRHPAMAGVQVIARRRFAYDPRLLA